MATTFGPYTFDTEIPTDLINYDGVRQNVVAKSGSAMRFTEFGGGAGGYLQLDTATVDLTGLNNLYFQQDYRFTALPPVKMVIIGLGDSWGGQCVLALNADGTLSVYEGTGDTAIWTSTADIDVDTWYTVTLRCGLVAGAIPAAWAVYLDGNLLGSGYSATLPSIYAEVIYGAVAGGQATSSIYYIDNVQVSTELGGFGMVNGGIAGTVTNAFTHDPIAGAMVIIDDSGTPPTGAETGATGRYGIGNLEPGGYYLTVTADNYETAEGGGQVVLGETTTVDFELIPLGGVPSIRTNRKGPEMDYIKRDIGMPFRFFFNTTKYSDGSVLDASPDPSWRVYKDSTGAAIQTGTCTKIDGNNTTGFYLASGDVTTAGGYEVGKLYTVRVEAAVSGYTGAIVVGQFRVVSVGVEEMAEIKAATDQLHFVGDNVLADIAAMVGSVDAPAAFLASFAQIAATNTNVATILLNALPEILEAVSPQGVATLSHKFVDENGAGICDVQTWITADDDGVDQGVPIQVQVSDNAGEILYHVDPGSYWLRARKDGAYQECDPILKVATL